MGTDLAMVVIAHLGDGLPRRRACAGHRPCPTEREGRHSAGATGEAVALGGGGIPDVAAGRGRRRGRAPARHGQKERFERGTTTVA